MRIKNLPAANENKMDATPWEANPVGENDHGAFVFRIDAPKEGEPGGCGGFA